MSAKADFKTKDDYKIGRAIETIVEYSLMRNFRMDEKTVQKACENAIILGFGEGLSKANMQDGLKQASEYMERIDDDIRVYLASLLQSSDNNRKLSVKDVALLINKSEETVRNYARKDYKGNKPYNTYLKATDEDEKQKRFDVVELYKYLKVIDSDKILLQRIRTSYSLRD